MAALDDILATQGQQASQLDDLAAMVRSLVGQYGAQQRAALEDRLAEPLPSDRRTLSPKTANIGSTVLGNAQPYDLFPSLAANWTFTYNSDGSLDSAWRTGDEGAASVIVKWENSLVTMVSVARGGRRSEIRLAWVAGVLVALSRTFSIFADPSTDEFLAYYFLTETRTMAGSFAATPTADFLAPLYN